MDKKTNSSASKWKLTKDQAKTIELISHFDKPSSSNYFSKQSVVALVALLFTVISLIRIPYVGTFLDDVVFTFAFGWGKYIAYGIIIFFEMKLFFKFKFPERYLHYFFAAIVLILGFLWFASYLGGAFLLEGGKNLYAVTGLKITNEYITAWVDNSIFKGISHNGEGYISGWMGGGLIGFFFHGVASYASSIASLIIAILVIVIGLSYMFTNTYFGFYRKLIFRKKQENKVKFDDKKTYRLEKQKIDPKAMKQIEKETELEKQVDKIQRTVLLENIDRQIDKHQALKLDSQSFFIRNKKMNVQSQQAVISSKPRESSTWMDYHLNKPNTVVRPYGNAAASPRHELIKVEEEDNHGFVWEGYSLPSPALLNTVNITSESEENKNYAQKQMDLIIDTFRTYEIDTKAGPIHIGPRVINMELIPKIGTRLSKVITLENDLKLALAVKTIRIQAPIPGKSAIGIEIPNTLPKKVSFRELLINGDRSSVTTMYIGKDLLDNTITADITKMPHLLIAGSTGSGKSVFMASVILSILFNAKPHEVKMILIDPKKVELAVFANVPHLAHPIVTDAQEANNILKKVVKEMDTRYDIFQEAGAKNIESYNEKQTSQKDKMSYLIVIVDELADLMMLAGKEVEASIIRITQLARAAGIHLLVATQRPSVDIITGIIKANIPSRVAFAVSSQIDSRTILDSMGAESLLGKGDMLFAPIGTSSPNRIQAAYIEDNEIAKVINFCKNQGRPRFWKSLETNEEAEFDAEIDEQIDVNDPSYKKAKKLIIMTRKATPSFLQKSLGLTYIKAIKFLDTMEQEGLIGPQVGNKAREVFI